MNAKGRERFEAIEREVERWPDVTVELVEGGKHPKAKFKFEGRVLARPFAGTGSDSAFGIHQMLGDMRRTMRQLGAERDRPEPTPEEDEAPYRKPNDGAAKRPDPVAREKAQPQPDVADQLVAAGVVTPERRAAVQASGSADTYRKRAEVEEALPGPTDEEREMRLADLQAAIEAIEPGIYFGLEPEVYHGVPALGSSSLQKLLVSPADFWRGSWLDPDRPELDEESTKAQILGKAYHCARLEPDRLDLLFVRQPIKDDYPARGMLTSDAAVKAALKELGETQAIKDETIEERCERLADCGYEGTIWPLVMAQWRETLGTRQPIPGDLWDDMMTDMERMRAVPAVAEKLTGGAAEVSVFWIDEGGRRCKARYDYLRPDSWADLKTFDNKSRKDVRQAMADAVRFDRIYVQATHYRDGLEAVRRGDVDIRGDATEAQNELIEQLVAREAPPSLWLIFQQKGGVPNLYAKRFLFGALDAWREEEIRMMLDDPDKQVLVRDAMMQKSQIARRGEIEVRRAKELFDLYSQVYRPGQPWGPLDPEGTIGDDDFSPYWLEGKR